MGLEKECCPRRRWGKTELSIPVTPFGTQGFGGHFGPVNDEEAMALMRRAVDLGVNHFDCARCYGDSLHKLGRAIKEGVIARNEIIISGRVCCHSAAAWGGYGEGRPDYSAARALADVEDQLAILGIEKFDVLFLHDPHEIEPTLEAGGALEGLERVRQQGAVDFIGYGMRPHDFHLAHIASGRHQRDAVLQRLQLAPAERRRRYPARGRGCRPRSTQRLVDHARLADGRACGALYTTRQMGRRSATSRGHALVVQRTGHRHAGTDAAILPTRGTDPRQPNRLVEHRATRAKRRGCHGHRSGRNHCRI